MSFRTADVEPALRQYVRRILIQEDEPAQPMQPATYQVLPGPYPVLGFQYRGQLAVLQGPTPRTLDRIGVTGLLSSARSFQPSADTGTILVCLTPEGAYGLLGWPMDELADRHVGLGELGAGPAVRALESCLDEAAAPDRCAALTQTLLIALLKHSAQRPHPIVTEAARRIVRRHGTERIGDLARDLGIGERQLERLFRSQVGVGPKRLASLAQFDWARRRIEGGSWAALASEAGYADQAHLIRSFRAYSGVSPSQYRPDPAAG